MVDFHIKKAMSGLKEKDLEMINWAMKVTGIFELANRTVDSLSGGSTSTCVDCDGFGTGNRNFGFR